MCRRAWLATGSAILAGITIALAQNKVIPCAIVLQQEFKIGLTVFGWLSSVFCVMSILMAFPAALIVNKLGVKIVCILSLICTISGSFFGMVSHSVGLLMASRIIEGAGAGLISVVVPTVISMWFPPTKRGLPTGLWSSWQFVAQALCFFFGVSIIEKSGWRGVWFSVILIGAAILILCIFWLGTRPDGESYMELSDGEGTRMIDGLCSHSVWLASGSMFCFCFSCFGFINWAALCWTEQFGILPDMANRYVSLFALISLPVVITAGIIMDHVNRKKFGIIVSSGYIFAVSAAFLLPSARWILPFVIIYPFFEGGISTCLWTIIPQTVSNSRHISIAVALFTMTSNIGMLAGPPVTGAIVELTGLWGMGALPVGVSMIIGTILFTQIKLY